MIPKYQLWHGVGTRSFRVLWVAEELGIFDHFDIHEVPFPPRIKARHFLDVNPVGSLPYFRDGEAVLTESMAIGQYLVARHGPSTMTVASDESGYADFLQFSMFGEAALMPPIGGMVRYHLVDGPERRSEAALSDARGLFSMRLTAVDRALQDGRTFLAADRLTLADVAVAYALGLVEKLGEQQLFTPRVAEYLAGLKLRPAWIRASMR